MNPRPLNTIFEIVVAAVEHRFGLNPGQLKRRRRNDHIAGPRQVAMYLLMKVTHQGYGYCAWKFKRDRGTCIHAEKQVQVRMETNLEFAKTIRELEEEIRR